MKKLLIYILPAVILCCMKTNRSLAIHPFYKVDTSGTCYSAVLDTAVNPFTLGIAGNWRPRATYLFYGNRMEGDSRQNINTRQAGGLAAFTPFWKRQNGAWKAGTDDSSWVWNSQSTMFNVKGFEIENKDPLGRYNAGIYGYDNELPILVAQNSHYRELVFDGFEDYYYGDALLSAVCTVPKSFDFTIYKPYIDTTTTHSGRYALRIPKGATFSVAASVNTSDTADFKFTINRKQAPCGQGTDALQGIRANSTVIIPSFTPYAGKRMLISAWVKEKDDCLCDAFTQPSIVVRTGSANYICSPTGKIIEGWQRIEEVIDIPADAINFAIDMKSGSKTDVYIDDIRIHPYNCNVKSYVYDPLTLRLMAELDENNFATFFEYDDDGTLIRVKKETERGIKTIKETRSALIKDENPQ